MIKHFSTWTEEDKQNYKELWKKHNHLQLQRIYDCHEKTITNINRALGLKVGVTFGKGYSKRKDSMPVGTVVIHKRKGVKALAYIIGEDRERVRLHHYNWKKAGNDIPEGYLLGYKDHTIEDPIERDRLDNLVLKTRALVILENIKTRKAPVFKPRPPKQPKIRVRKERVKKEKQPKPVKVKIERIKPPKKEKPVKIKVIKEKPVKQPKNGREAVRPTPKRVEKVFKTTVRDFSKLIPVKIDHRTTVYARSEADIPRILERYSKKAS